MEEDPVGTFPEENLRHTFRGQWIEVEAIRGVEVGTDRFWIVVDNNRFMPSFSNRLHGMYSSVVELNALANSDGSRSNDDQTLAFDLLLGRNMVNAQWSATTFVGCIVVRRDRSEFGCTGIDHAEAWMDGQLMPTLHHINLCSTIGQSIPATRRESRNRICNVGICEAEAFPSPHLSFSDFTRLTVSRDDFGFNICDFLESVKEPSSDIARALSNLLDAHTTSKGLDQSTQPSVSGNLEPIGKNVVR